MLHSMKSFRQAQCKGLRAPGRSLAPKPDGTAKLCVDIRGLNAITGENPYPFPSTESILYSLGDATVSSTLGCSRGSLQIQAALPRRMSHAIEFKRVPFGLTN